MFREGQYLEVIKTSNDCLATVVVTVQEKTIEIKKKKVSTNKWLNLEDWAALYKILERALRNDERQKKYDGCQWRKSTRHLEITYTIESPECTMDPTSLPTIRVNVSPARKKSEKVEINEQTHDDVQQDVETLDVSMPEKKKSMKSEYGEKFIPLQIQEKEKEEEEYVPDAPTNKTSSTLNYIPSRKSTLKSMQIASNEYTPGLKSSENKDVFTYVPNSLKNTDVSYETYEPCGISTPNVELTEEYVPNSKGAKASVEEYEPDFRSKSMKFDYSYIPSSVKTFKESTKRSHKIEKLKSRRKGIFTNKKKMELF